MKYSFSFVFVSVFILFVAGNIAASSQDIIIIKEIQKDKEPVSFTHKDHGAKFLVGCAICHHNDSAGNEHKCSKCHGAVTDGKKLDLKDAFHQQCRGCHQKKHGPTKCTYCHKK